MLSLAADNPSSFRKSCCRLHQKGDNAALPCTLLPAGHKAFETTGL